MSKKLNVRSAVMVALLAAFSVSNVAYAIYEVDSNDSRNDSIATAQPLEIGDGGSVEVTAVLGVMDPSAPLANDLDFFSFHGTAGDVVTIDIDGGMKTDSTTRSVDTIVAIFRPDLSVLVWKNDGLPVDSGSSSGKDARIDAIALPDTGTYYVGVSSYPRIFLDGGGLMMDALVSNGSYSMIISGVTPALSVQHMNFEVKPGNRQRAAFNPKSKGNIPVALLSSATFKPLEDVNRDSITFGATGNEISLRHCQKEGSYINDDDILDLVCHFDTQVAGFGPADVTAFVKGKTHKGTKFEGQGDLKVVPAMRLP